TYPAPQRDVRGPRRPDAAGDPEPPRPGRGVGDGAGQAVPDEPARDLQAPEGPGARGPDFARPGRATAAVPDRGQAARGSPRVAGELPPDLGRQLPATRRAARGDEGRAEETWTRQALAETADEEPGNVESHDAHRPGDRDDPHLRRPARTGLRRPVQARVPPALVARTAGVVDGGLRERPEGGWRLSPRVARPRRERDGGARRLPRGRAARARRPHGNVRVRVRLPVGRAGRDRRPYGAGRPDHAHDHGAVPVEGGPRRDHRLRHGARRGRQLRPACRPAGSGDRKVKEPVLNETSPARRALRRTGAVLAGLVAIVILSVGADAVLHAVGVYPPWGEPMDDALFLLATAYRVVFGIAGRYLAAPLP